MLGQVKTKMSMQPLLFEGLQETQLIDLAPQIPDTEDGSSLMMPRRGRPVQLTSPYSSASGSKETSN
jgi:hypothetical protein